MVIKISVTLAILAFTCYFLRVAPKDYSKRNTIIGLLILLLLIPLWFSERKWIHVWNMTYPLMLLMAALFFATNRKIKE